MKEAGHPQANAHPPLSLSSSRARARACAGASPLPHHAPPRHATAAPRQVKVLLQGERVPRLEGQGAHRLEHLSSERSRGGQGELNAACIPRSPLISILVGSSRVLVSQESRQSTDADKNNGARHIWDRPPAS